MQISIKDQARIVQAKKDCYDQGFKDGVASKSTNPLKDSISELTAIRNGIKMFKRIPKNQFIRDIDAVIAKLESI